MSARTTESLLRQMVSRLDGTADVEAAKIHLAQLDARRAADAAHDELYPEHAKLAKVKVESQAIGLFLDYGPWQLMEWQEWDETYEEECVYCTHSGPTAVQRCHDEQRCRNCKGEHVIRGKRHHQGHFPVPGSIQDILARYYEIDQTKLEQEKRAMLAQIREANSQ